MTQARTHVCLLSPGCPIDTHELKTFAAEMECGAVVAFEGIVRGTEDSRHLAGLEYDYHEVMAVSELRRIVTQASKAYDVQSIACAHRVGLVPVQQASVAIVVGAQHRKAAFEACEAVMDQIKVKVPIWKTPVYSDNVSAIKSQTMKETANG